jgi:myo-inositol-1(or 4)-monophosphatase
VILQNLGHLSAGDIDSKQASDFVTTVDTESEKVIIDTIRAACPEHHFLAEESLKEEGEGGHRWIIDPLDGTTNFIHGYPVFAVSIALESEGEIILGVVLDPLRDELFTAEVGQGAFVNGTRLGVRGTRTMGDSLIATGFPFRQKTLIDPYLDAFKRILLRVSDLRRAGSAALDLAHLAAGRCDGFFELGLSPWDMAAGCLMIGEAGGVVSDFGGGGEYLKTGNIVAGTPVTHPGLLKEVRAAFGGIIEQ